MIHCEIIRLGGAPESSSGLSSIDVPTGPAASRKWAISYPYNHDLPSLVPRSFPGDAICCQQAFSWIQLRHSTNMRSVCFANFESASRLGLMRRLFQECRSGHPAGSSQDAPDAQDAPESTGHAPCVHDPPPARHRPSHRFHDTFV